MLTSRPLTRSEAETLNKELKSTPNILGYTVAELLRFSDVLVAEVEGQFAGVCVSKDLLFGWTDIAMLYIIPSFRGKGLARELYSAAFQKAQKRGRHIYTLSCSPPVIHLMEQFGMEMQKAMWKAPLAVHLHMNWHMMSLYRMKEVFRKRTKMKKTVPFVSGTRRNDELRP